MKEAAMRTLMAVVVLGVAIAVYSALPSAAGEKGGVKTAGGLAERIQDLQLTDAQEAKITDIRKECKPKVQEAAKDLGALLKEEEQKIRAVLTDDQKKKLESEKELHKAFKAEHLCERIIHVEELGLSDGEMTKITEIRKECHPKTVKAMKGLEGILTDEQKNARVKALDAGMKRSEVLASLKLSNDQKGKVEAVGKEVRGIVHDELAQMRDVLSAGQKEKLPDIKDERREHARDRVAFIIANLKDLNLSDAQRGKIMEIRKEFRPKVHEAGNRLRGAVREEVEAIVAVIKG
jgi:Spy/CpxP family protein refolding chaperone